MRRFSDQADSLKTCEGYPACLAWTSADWKSLGLIEFRQHLQVLPWNKLVGWGPSALLRELAAFQC